MLKSNKCPTCAGYFVFSPKDNALKCQSCGAIRQVNCSDKINQHDYESNKGEYITDWTKDAKTVKCQNCGANIIVNRFSLVDKCSYCGGATLVDVENTNSIKPDAVLPFSIDVDQARTFFREGLKGKMFVPNVLKKQLPQLNIVSRYINAYVFNAELVATYNGRLEYSETETDKDGYTHTYTYTRLVSGTMPHKIVDFAIESSSNLSQGELNKIMPYNLANLKSYSGEFLYGSSAEYSNKSLEDANRELENYVRQDVEHKIVRKHSADRVVSMNLVYNYSYKNYCYCLLPTYIFNYDYKKKHYSTIMNGTTGKLGGGVPRSGVKITSFVLAILFTILGIGLLIYFCL